MMMGSMRKDSVPPDMRAKGPEKHPFGVMERENTALIALDKDTKRLHLIVDMNRIGGKLFNVKMEYTYFAPRSGKNYLYEMVLIKWPDVSVGFQFLWAIASFPIEFRPQAEALAKECGLRIANGIPTIIDADGAHHFPLDGGTVFTLENITGHQVYKNDPDNQKRLREEESAACDAIISADRKKLHEEMAEQGYSEEQYTRILEHWDKGDEAYDEVPAMAKDGQHRHTTGARHKGGVRKLGDDK